MTTELIKKVANLNSDDNKMLLLNGRYYCQLTLDKQLDVPEHYCFFSESWKEQNCPTLTQYTDCYVLDTDLEHGHHCSQFAKLYHSVHMDLDNSDSFSLMLSLDNALVSVTSIEIIDKPYQLKKLIDLLDKDAVLPEYPEYGPDDVDPIRSLDGVCFIDFGHYGDKTAAMEYYITGKLYFEIVNFKDVPDGGIVSLDDMSRREIVVNMPCNGGVLNDDNVAEIAELINTRLRTLKKETENDNRS